MPNGLPDIRTWCLAFRLACGLALITLMPGLAGAQGLVLPGVGPVNRSMAGATVAAPIDAAGSMHWNPASISGLPGSEVIIGAEFVYPLSKVTSSVGGVSGTDHSDSGVSLLPTTALVYQPDDSPWTYGLGLYGIGGFFVNYPANPSNPVLAPPAFGGAGPVYANLSVLQVAPTAALQVTDSISLGFAPTVTAATLTADPGTSSAPNANGSYPPATHSRLQWGLGFQAGIYVTTATCWNFGLSYKSPQWFEDFKFNAFDAAGLPRTLTLQTTYPSISSIGVSYSGFERTLIAVDVRYVDFANSTFIGDSAGFAPDASVTGLGWNSVWSVSAGIQREINECLTLRAGYFYTQNPIPDSATFFNIASPAIYQHALFLGGTRRLNQSLTLSLAYYHAFHTSITGMINAPGIGPVPGTLVESSQISNGLVVGIGVNF